ncbi:MAG: HAD-IA family hydrolase, partial [Pikeienuella sp.]
QLMTCPDTVPPAALDTVKGAGFKTGCITNNMPKGAATEWARSEEDKAMAAAIMARFDHVIESAEAGVRKPEPRIYEMMCEALGVLPTEAVFLDDLGVNLKPAQAMGMATIKVPLDDYQHAIQELATLTGLSL